MDGGACECDTNPPKVVGVVVASSGCTATGAALLLKLPAFEDGGVAADATSHAARSSFAAAATHSGEPS
jgi:hypothetical protein